MPPHRMLHAAGALALLALGLAYGCASAPPADPSPKAATSVAVTSSASASAPAGSSSAAPVAPPKFAACEAPPVGMVCIPGGPAVVGSDDGNPRERPRHTVEISTFYIDKTEVTNAAYASCEAAKACPLRIPSEPGFGGASQPAVPITFEGAFAYCRFAGKRLLTEAEWEKVARAGEKGQTYPWGEEPPTCERAQTVGCAPKTTLPVGSLPAGAYGVFDMAGNGYEWVQDWATDCFDGCKNACGAACTGLDPQGPCGGSPFCGQHKQRILKGGSWFWPAEEVRAAHRRPNAMSTGQHRLSIRCASTTPVLTTWPPLAVTDPLPRPADPAPPSTAELAIFRDVVDDEDVLEIKLCANEGEATHDCRDPHNYLSTNEIRQFVWEPFLDNRGGAYVGLGADQSYNFIGAARSTWAWLFDYDPAVVRLHYALRGLILASETPTELISRLEAERKDETVAIIRKSFEGAVFAGGKPLPESEREAAISVLLQGRNLLHDRYLSEIKATRQGPASFGWLRNPASYAHVRKLYQQNRILSIRGNLLTERSLPAIAAAARKLHVPVRVYYTSNADDQWDLTDAYRRNFVGMPFDKDTVWIRTVFNRSKAGVRHNWDYVVHDGLDAQRLLRRPGWDRLFWMQRFGRRDSDVEDLVTFALPARTQREPTPAK